MGQHTAVRRHKRAFVTLKDGRHLILRFHKREGDTLYFYDHEPIKRKLVRAVSDYKPKGA